MTLLGLILTLNVTATRADEVKMVTRDAAVRVAEAVSHKLGHLPSPLSRTRVGIARCKATTRAVNADVRFVPTVPCVALYPATMHAFEQLRRIFGDDRDDVIITYQLSTDGPTWPDPGAVVDADDPDALVAGLADVLSSMKDVVRVGWERAADGSPTLVVTTLNAAAARALRTLWPVDHTIKQMAVRITSLVPAEIRPSVVGPATLLTLAKLRTQLDALPELGTTHLSLAPFESATGRVGRELTTDGPFEIVVVVGSATAHAREQITRHLGDEVDGIRLIHRTLDGDEFGRINPVDVFHDVAQLTAGDAGVSHLRLGRDTRGPRVDVFVRDEEARRRVRARLPASHAMNGVPLDVQIQKMPASAECEGRLAGLGRRLRGWLNPGSSRD